MKKHNWYLRRTAVVLFSGAALSLALTASLFNKKGAILAGALTVMLSLMAAMALALTNPNSAPWAIITSGVMMMLAVALSASLFQHSSLWLLHLPGWGAGPMYWLLLRECKDSLVLVSFTLYVAVEAVLIAVFLSRMLT